MTCAPETGLWGRCVRNRNSLSLRQRLKVSTGRFELASRQGGRHHLGELLNAELVSARNTLRQSRKGEFKSLRRATADIEQAWATSSLCSYLGGNPFQVVGRANEVEVTSSSDSDEGFHTSHNGSTDVAGWGEGAVRRVRIKSQPAIRGDLRTGVAVQWTTSRVCEAQRVICLPPENAVPGGRDRGADVAVCTVRCETSEDEDCSHAGTLVGPPNFQLSCSAYHVASALQFGANARGCGAFAGRGRGNGGAAKCSWRQERVALAREPPHSETRRRALKPTGTN